MPENSRRKYHPLLAPLSCAKAAGVFVDFAIFACYDELYFLI
jgi:hypothetical protein